MKFLREIGEFTEASYHFPQGLHLGHLLYIIKVVNSGQFKKSHLNKKFVKLRGNFDPGRLGIFQRQTKYKLQGLMELGLLVDDRTLEKDEKLELKLNPQGLVFYKLLKPVIENINLSFKKKQQNIPSWDMNIPATDFNLSIRSFILKHKNKKDKIRAMFLEMHAIRFMLNYLYRVERKKIISKADIYKGFFNSQEVARYCDQNGIEVATEEGAKHRCPFFAQCIGSNRNLGK